eukprot:8050678-Pyramimonas_sp.AAC.1
MVVRMTGCPNGCARPYMAELGLVCDGPNTYQLWLGACPNQTRISECFMDKMKIGDLEKVRVWESRGGAEEAWRGSEEA